jgi:hypothetical protein
MSKEAPRPEEPFGFSEREQLFDRVSRQRFRAIFDDEATDVHRVELAHNSFGEFLFITTSRALGPGRLPVTFYGLGYHEQRERWLVGEWFFYHANPHPSTTACSIAKEEAREILDRREAEIAAYAAEDQQTERGRLFEMLADLIDEDGALAEMDELEDLWDDFE